MALLDSADIAAVFADNSVEDVSSVPNAPVYEWHSKNQVLIPVEAIDSTMARYCEAGEPVTSDESLRTRPPLGGRNHPYPAQPEFLDDRFAGIAPTTSC